MIWKNVKSDDSARHPFAVFWNDWFETRRTIGSSRGTCSFYPVVFSSSVDCGNCSGNQPPKREKTYLSDGNCYAAAAWFVSHFTGVSVIPSYFPFLRPRRKGWQPWLAFFGGGFSIGGLDWSFVAKLLKSKVNSRVENFRMMCISKL